MEDKLQTVTAKLLNVFDVIIDKATGTEALALLKSYMFYIQAVTIIELLSVVVTVGLMIYGGVLIKRVLKFVREWYAKEEDEIIFLPTALGGAIVFIVYAAFTSWILSATPQLIAILYDPRLYFVFKALK